MPFFPPLVVKGNLRISSNVSIYLLNRKKVGSALENRSIILLMVCFARYIKDISGRGPSPSSCSFWRLDVRQSILVVPFLICICRYTPPAYEIKKTHWLIKKCFLFPLLFGYQGIWNVLFRRQDIENEIPLMSGFFRSFFSDLLQLLTSVTNGR